MRDVRPKARDWIEPEAFGLGWPDFADLFVGGEALQGLETQAEVFEVLPQPVMAAAVITFDGRVLDGALALFGRP